MRRFITAEFIIDKVLVPSVIKLYKIDYNNIRIGVSERNICARLAHHMENIMRDYDKNNHRNLFSRYFADIEYDKMNNGDLKQYETPLHRPKRMISDLLIHSRGALRNLLAVEMKRKDNYNKRREDRERLMAMVSTEPVNSDLHCVYGTLAGAFIIYSEDTVKIEIYENVDGLGQKTRELRFRYSIRDKKLEFC